MGSRTLSVQAGEGCAGILICCSFTKGGLVTRGNRAGGVAEFPQEIIAGACHPIPAITVPHIRVRSHIILWLSRRNGELLSGDTACLSRSCAGFPSLFVTSRMLSDRRGARASSLRPWLVQKWKWAPTPR